MLVYYNDNDPFACAWLAGLMAHGLIPAGDIDSRSIRDVRFEEVCQYGQLHWFAGVGGWPLALQLAGWGDRPVWTASCPCFPAGTLVMAANGYKPIEDIVVGDMVLTHRARFRRVQQVGSATSECVVVKGQGHYGLVCTPEHPFLVRDEEWCDAQDLKGRRWANVIEVPAVPMPELEPTARGFYFDRAAKRYRVKGDKDGRQVYVGTFLTADEAKSARVEAVRSGRIDKRGADAADVRSLGFARFLGYWVGDGWVSRDTVLLCGSRGECALLDGLFKAAGLPGKAYLEPTSSRIRCGSTGLASWLREQFGEYAHGKRIPVWLYGMPEDYRRAFIAGYLLADGHEETQAKGGGRVQVFTTASKALAVGVRVLLNQLGLSASIRVIHNQRRAVIEGRSVSEAPLYRVTAYETARSFRLSGRHGWGLVRSVESAGTHTVYNLAVEEDESYTADGIVVHNCQPFSAAGKRKGEADERHLWPVFFNLVRECRPPVIFGEQVTSGGVVGTSLEAAFLASVQAGDNRRANEIAERLAGRDDPENNLRCWFDGICDDLEAEGYTVWACDLPACSAGEEAEGWVVRGDTAAWERVIVGAPHIRQRLFWVAESNRSFIRGESSAGQQPEHEQDRRVGRLVHPEVNGRLQGRPESDGRNVGATGDADGLADAMHAERRTQRAEDERGPGGGDAAPGIDAEGAAWSDFLVILCRDSKLRRVSSQRGDEPLAHGVPTRRDDPRMGHLLARLGELGHDPKAARRILREARSNRVGRLKGYGNAIIPQLAAVFVRAFIEWRSLKESEL